MFTAGCQCLAPESVISGSKIRDSRKHENTARLITASSACCTTWRTEVPISRPALGGRAVGRCNLWVAQGADLSQ
jgi:hypothetical protein